MSQKNLVDVPSLRPKPTAVTAPYWEATAKGEFRIQQCHSCGQHYFYPRMACRYCLSTDVEWVEVSGKARLISYNINYRPLPGLAPPSPVIALVELDEGPRMMTNIVGVEPKPENLPLDMRLTVQFAESEGMMLPVFAPEKGIS